MREAGRISVGTIPIRVVSGGQTGVDRAALSAARSLGIPYGGWLPKGRITKPWGQTPPLPSRPSKSSLDYLTAVLVPML